MKTHHSLLLLASTMVGSTASAQLFNVPKGEGVNRLGVSARFGFNASAEFSNLGGFTAQSDPGAFLGPPPHFYDDGYVLFDSTMGADEFTSNWGYSNSGQDTGNSIIMATSFAASDLRASGSSDEPQLGFEVSYGRLLGRGKRFSWGLEGALGYANLGFSDGSTMRSDVIRVSDEFDYNFGGASPPPAPYAGVSDRTGTPEAALLQHTPSTTLTEAITDGAIVVGQRELDSSLIGLRIGPFLEMPLFRRASAAFSAGLSLAMIDSEFSYSESVTVPDIGATLQPGVTGTQTRSGTGSDSGLLFGGYLGARFSYALTRQWDLFSGVQFQYLGTFDQSLDGKKAETDLGQSVFVSIGAAYFF